MSRTQGQLEIELAAKSLRRDEEARDSLAGPNRWTYGAVAALVIGTMQTLANAWSEVPAVLGVAVAVLIGAVIALSFELYIARRRINAIVRLLRLPSDA
jgi:hypothetical protein